LKIVPRAGDCNGFLKFFASAAKIVTMIGDAGFCTLYQKLGAGRRDCSIATLAKTHSRTSNHGLSEFSLGVSLCVFATPTALQISAV
jgi:hypothetical protein